MKIVLLTPGTGNFHCENCLHDHALANGLISAGHDAVVYPLYLPIVADTESPGPQRSLQMSGLNVYLQEKLPFYSNMPGWMKRVMSSRGLLELSARFAGMTSARELGELTLSMLSGSDGRQLAEIEALVDSVKASDHPDVIILSNVMLVGLAPALRSAFDVPVICSLQGEDVFLDSLEDPYRDQAWQVLREKCNFIDHFVAVSSYYNAAICKRLSLSESQTSVVRTGVRVVDYAPRDYPPSVPAIGFMSRLIPDKGLEELVEAFIQLKGEPGFEPLQLRIAGASTPAEKKFIQSLWQRLRQAGVSEHAEIRENLTYSDKIAHLRSLSVCTVPIRYADAFGLYLIESLAAGTPVVLPDRGAHAELIKLTQGGLVYDPEDESGLVTGLRRMLQDKQLAMESSVRGRRHVERSFSETTMAAEMLSVITRCTNDQGPGMSEPINPSAITQTDPIIELRDVYKRYDESSREVLKDVSLAICPADRISIMGPSGSGKSTLLNILGTLDVPSSGVCEFGGQDVSGLNPGALAAIRNTRVGFVFQQHHLLPHCNALDNILVPVLALHARTSRVAEQRAHELLERVGLSDRAEAFPHQLSGGERQRVAVLRALINYPDLILADEPTGALDHDNALRLVDLLSDLADDQNAALVLVSHSAALADHMTLRYQLNDGVLSPR